VGKLLVVMVESKSCFPTGPNQSRWSHAMLSLRLELSFFCRLLFVVLELLLKEDNSYENHSQFVSLFIEQLGRYELS
jgi:hypothetical protein